GGGVDLRRPQAAPERCAGARRDVNSPRGRQSAGLGRVRVAASWLIVGTWGHHAHGAHCPAASNTVVRVLLRRTGGCRADFRLRTAFLGRNIALREPRAHKPAFSLTPCEPSRSTVDCLLRTEGPRCLIQWQEERDCAKSIKRFTYLLSEIPAPITALAIL